MLPSCRAQLTSNLCCMFVTAEHVHSCTVPFPHMLLLLLLLHSSTTSCCSHARQLPPPVLISSPPFDADALQSRPSSDRPLCYDGRGDAVHHQLQAEMAPASTLLLLLAVILRQLTFTIALVACRSASKQLPQPLLAHCMGAAEVEVVELPEPAHPPLSRQQRAHCQASRQRELTERWQRHPIPRIEVEDAVMERQTVQRADIEAMVEVEWGLSPCDG